jgi:hypothetical protein
MLRKLTAAVFTAAILIAAPAFAVDTPSQASSPATHQPEKQTEKQTKVSHPVRSGHHVRHAKRQHRAKQHLAGAHKVSPPKHAQAPAKRVTSAGAN